MSKKILLLIASVGFQPLEYSGTKEELEKAGFEVFIGSDKKGVAASQENFMRVQADVAIADININDYDGKEITLSGFIYQTTEKRGDYNYYVEKIVDDFDNEIRLSKTELASSRQNII